MKILTLRKRIYTNLSIAALLLVVLSLIIAYDSHRKQSEKNEAERVQFETATIRGKSVELQNKVAEAKKYEEIWKTINKNKKFIGNIKIDDLTSKIDSLSDKYSIEKPAIKMTIPEDMPNPPFKRNTVMVTMSSGTLMFSAVSDTKAISFISEFINSVPGYIVISNFDMRRTKKYTDQDLIQISTGTPSGALTIKADFFWYMYKSKNDGPSNTSTTEQPNRN